MKNLALRCTTCSKRTIVVVFALLMQTHLLCSSSTSEVAVNIPWTGVMRVKTLESLDRLLALAFDHASRSYKLSNPLNDESYHNSLDEIIRFADNYGYFSTARPLIGQVTEEKEDTDLTCHLLRSVFENDLSPRAQLIATSEILSKILAYRNLQEGDEIPIPSMNNKGHWMLASYQVEHIFDLWHGMPAFGLMPKEEGSTAPILLFRGTDLSLGSTRSWASVISDLNTAGPGLSTFLKAQTMIHTWLKKAAKTGVKARLLGYSLGGVMSLYTLLYEKELVNQDKNFPSVAFNPPGVSAAMCEKWDQMPQKSKAAFISFVTRGDIVSKIGLLCGDVYELSLDKPMKPITAHVTLITGQPRYHLAPVNISKENASR